MYGPIEANRRVGRDPSVNLGRLPRGGRDLKNEVDFDMPSSVLRMALRAFYKKTRSGLGAGLKEG